MRAVSDGLLIAGGLTVVGYIFQSFLPNSSLITVDWNTQQYFIPYNVAAFWGCIAVGTVAGIIQAIRVLLRDVGRLQ